MLGFIPDEFLRCSVCGEESVYKDIDESTGKMIDICTNENCPTNKKPSNKSEDCIFKDFYDVCKNDDCPYYGQYCSGHCAFYESK